MVTIKVKFGIINFIVLLFLITPLVAQKNQALITYFEQSSYKRTPRYDSTIWYCKQLEQSTNFIRYTTLGKSHEWRDIPLLIAAKNNEFTPDLAHKSNKIIVLIQACIHAGEPDGKDAGFLLFRDFILDKKIRSLLDNCIILFIPIFNVDGHERFSPYNRINQNGPIEMGWRCNAQNLNLNRDYLKAQSNEIKAWLELYHTWQPHFFIDCHVTDGADYQYPITYALEIYGNMDDSITYWQKHIFLPKLENIMEKDGYPIFRYVSFRKWFDFESGLTAWVTPPSLSQGYTALLNRPGLLIESHMLKDYKTRVLSTYHMLKNTISLLSQNKDQFLHYIEIAANNDIPKTLPVAFQQTNDSTIVTFKGYEYVLSTSELSGGKWYKYNPDKPKTFNLPLFDHFIPSKIVTIPKFYIIPAGWADKLLPYLKVHHIKYSIVNNDTTIKAMFYKFTNVTLSNSSYEGCQRVIKYTLDSIERTENFKKGSILISTHQPNYRIIIHLLEPDAPASLFNFGFFNSIFEQKEYGETYILEELARKMLQDDTINKQYNEFIKQNPSSTSYEKLNWFYNHSQYADPYLNVYPIGKIK